MHMTEEELNAIVDARLAEALAARLAADRQRVKMEVVDQIRREAAAAHYDRINSRHPVEDKYGGLGEAGHKARLAAMDAARARRRAALTPGSEGFRVKG
jgi:hypothetical protein